VCRFLTRALNLAASGRHHHAVSAVFDPCSRGCADQSSKFPQKHAPSERASTAEAHVQRLPRRTSDTPLTDWLCLTNRHAAGLTEAHIQRLRDKERTNAAKNWVEWKQLMALRVAMSTYDRAHSRTSAYTALLLET
jgi:hypothetical protein